MPVLASLQDASLADEMFWLTGGRLPYLPGIQGVNESWVSMAHLSVSLWNENSLYTRSLDTFFWTLA